MDIVATVPCSVGTVNIVLDTYPESPREGMDNLGRMVCWHRRYALGDEHDFADPSDFRESVNTDAHIIMPVFMYEHSGVALSLKPFHDPWDSGQVGFVYVSKARVLKDFGVSDIDTATLNKVLNVFEAELKTYESYLNGNVYGFEFRDENGEHVDSCYGFYGMESVRSGIEDYAPEAFRQSVSTILLQLPSC